MAMADFVRSSASESAAFRRRRLQPFRKSITAATIGGVLFSRRLFVCLFVCLLAG